MADDTGTRLRNLSPYGPVWVPAVGDGGTVVEYRHEIVVSDPDVAASLIASGNFVPIGSPRPDSTPEPFEPGPAAPAAVSEHASAPTTDATPDTPPAAAAESVQPAPPAATTEPDPAPTVDQPTADEGNAQ